MKPEKDSRRNTFSPPTVRHFIVVFDDEQGLCVPFGWDDECEGAICCNNGKVALFAGRKSARRAIEISAKFAALRESQGVPANTDFSRDCRKSIRVMECVPNVRGDVQPAAKNP